MFVVCLCVCLPTTLLGDVCVCQCTLFVQSFIRAVLNERVVQKFRHNTVSLNFIICLSKHLRGANFIKMFKNFLYVLTEFEI